MASPSRSGSGPRKTSEMPAAAFRNSWTTLALPRMVAYLGAKSCSRSTPSSWGGRSLMWPLLERTTKSRPRYFCKVLALVGDSTIRRDLGMFLNYSRFREFACHGLEFGSAGIKIRLNWRLCQGGLWRIKRNLSCRSILQHKALPRQLPDQPLQLQDGEAAQDLGGG